ncbi:MAG: DUF883 domain-containing protein [Rhodoferax sp.]|uniref:DUF883 family protein n=1 Tax=Rhodoferax sp. TaxID=50421 RepID=UPI0017B69C47|nr:hypothetical protein [Rhodoferax sp.]NMM20052.1 DUF883 domain-containing protein [Rhodoferax sp.]
METYNDPSRSDAVAGAAGNVAARVGTSAVHLMDATKTAGKQIGAVAKEEVTSLRADLDDLTSRLSSLSEFELTAAKEKILAKIEAVKLAAKGVTTDVGQQLNHGVGVTTEYVKGRPLQSLAVAAGIGILLGMLMSRR